MNQNAIPGAPNDVVRVFVSYAREDKRWLDPEYRFNLVPFLVDSLRRQNVEFWIDRKLVIADEYRQLIETEIDRADIALLIVSQYFVNSSFIEAVEMPRIEERARRGEMLVAPVLVEPCAWQEYPLLADRQMVPASNPLIDYTDNESRWAKVRFEILEGLKTQVKRIREAPKPAAQKAQTSVRAEVQPVPPPIPISEPAPVPISEPAKAPAVETAPPIPTPKAAVSEIRAKIYPAEHEKARTERNWTSAVLGGTVLVGVVAMVLLYHSFPPELFRLAMGGAPLAAALVCLLIFKPFPLKWNLAAVGGAALVSAVWVRIALAGWTPLIWTFLFMDGAALALVVVCLRVFKPIPRNWIPAIVGGVALVAVLASPYLWYHYAPWIVMDGAPLAVVLVCFLVFKPFPRNWTPAVVGGMAMASAMWVYFAFARRFYGFSILTLAAMVGAALAAVFVCRLAFKPYPRNWIPDLVGGAALMLAVFGYWVFLRSIFYFWAFAVMDEAALAMLLVCLLVSRAREKA
jgi:hypothetical protein